MELNEFISGERFQGLASISFIPLGNGNGESQCGFVEEQQKNNSYNTFYYNENTTELPDEVRQHKIIFVNTWTLNKFFKIIFPLLNERYIFISHNSDCGIDNEHRVYLDNDKVIKWFTQNTYILHNKLYSLPIGLGNQQYSHGNLPLIKSIIDAKIPKDLLVFKNFNIHTNYNDRIYTDSVTSSNGIHMHPPMDQVNYFKTIAKSKFVISPPGNGIDCHRIWECLYLGAVPIVKNHICFMQFKHLPILFIDDWNVVTEHFLRKNIDFVNNSNLQELQLKYWRKLINIL